MNKIGEMIRDCGKAFLAGIAADVVIALVAFLISFLASSCSPAAGLETAKNGSFLLTAGLLFLLAAFLMRKGKKEEKEIDSSWKNQFRHIGFKTALAFLALGFVTVSAALDYVQFLMR